MRLFSQTDVAHHLTQASRRAYFDGHLSSFGSLLKLIRLRWPRRKNENNHVAIIDGQVVLQWRYFVSCELCQRMTGSSSFHQAPMVSHLLSPLRFVYFFHASDILLCLAPFLSVASVMNPSKDHLSSSKEPDVHPMINAPAPDCPLLSETCFLSPGT